MLLQHLLNVMKLKTEDGPPVKPCSTQKVDTQLNVVHHPEDFGYCDHGTANDTSGEVLVQRIRKCAEELFASNERSVSPLICANQTHFLHNYPKNKSCSLVNVPLDELFTSHGLFSSIVRGRLVSTFRQFHFCVSAAVSKRVVRGLRRSPHRERLRSVHVHIENWDSFAGNNLRQTVYAFAPKIGEAVTSLVSSSQRSSRGAVHKSPAGRPNGEFR